MTETASLETVLEFCNDVRDAGGANPLDALLPAVPQDSKKCLIARNLNFSCSVMPEPRVISSVTEYDWYMECYPSVVTKVLTELSDKWDVRPFKARIDRFYIPPEIAKVAMEFDEWSLDSLWQDYASAPESQYFPYITDEYKQTIEDEGIDISELI